MAKLAGLILTLSSYVDGARFKRASETSQVSWAPRLLDGKIAVERPAFLMLDKVKGQVLISQFGRKFKPGEGGWFPSIAESTISTLSLNRLGRQVGRGSLNGSLGRDDIFVSEDQKLKWPNKLSRAPKGHGDFIAIPDGFGPPPGKASGGVFLARADGTVARITRPQAGIFYHEVEWHDFNGDGNLDILTSRCIKQWFGFKFTGELVWLENPGKADMDKTFWEEHKIDFGPDVIFKSVPYKGGLAVFATEFWAKKPKISLHFLGKDGAKVGGRVIDDNLGKPFGVDIVDVDGDGNEELLVTNHQGPKDKILPAVFAYEVDWNDLANGDFKRHTLTSGPSKNKGNTPGIGAPGFAQAFYPKKNMKGPKYIYAAGDGAFDVWILKPSGKKFQYETQVIDINGTTGEILPYDFNKDGVMDLLIPDNDFWGLHVITFDRKWL